MKKKNLESIGKFAVGRDFFLNIIYHFISIISINLLAFYHECRSLVGYATHYLVKN